MEDIRIYDFSANLLHIENDIISAYWTIYYNKIGTFEGHFNLNGDIMPIIMDNSYLIIIQGDKQAILTGKQINLDNELIVYGRTVNWLLTRRVTDKFDTSELLSLDVQLITHQLIDRAFDAQDRLFCCVNQTGFTELDTFYNKTYRPTYDVIIDCLNKDNAGHRVSINLSNNDYQKGDFVYEAIKGREIPLILSKSNRNAYDMIFSENILSAYNGGYYEKENSDGSKIWTLQPSDKTGIYRWIGILKGNSQTEALSDLQSKSIKRSIESKVVGLDFSFDYSDDSYENGQIHLGDTLRVQKEFGAYKITTQKRIIGVDFWYEGNSYGILPILYSDEQIMLGG